MAEGSWESFDFRMQSSALAVMQLSANSYEIDPVTMINGTLKPDERLRKEHCHSFSENAQGSPVSIQENFNGRSV